MYHPKKLKYLHVIKKQLTLWVCLSFGVLSNGLSQADAILTNPSACQLNIPLADNTCPENTNFYSPNEFHITVDAGSTSGTVMGIDVYLSKVRLIVEHQWLSDLNIVLESPGGRQALLVANTGGNNDDLGDLLLPSCTGAMEFELAACTSILSGTAPFTDTSYRAIEDFYVFNDSISSPLGTWKLYICDDLSDDTGILQFAELVFAPLDCLPVQDVEVTALDSTSVTLSYTPTELCGGAAIVEIGPPGFTPGIDSFPGAGGQVFFVACPPFQIQGLQEDTDYDVYIRRICQAENSFSTNNCTASFSTGCLPGGMTEVETFDAEINCNTSCASPCEIAGTWRNVEGDDFDWLVHSGSTPTLSGTGPVDDITQGGNYIYLEANGSQCNPGAEAYLYSSCMSLDKMGSDSCHLSFNYHMFGITMGELRLEVSADQGLNWHGLWQKSGNQGDQWLKAYVGLGGYNDGDLLQFRFVGSKGNGVYGDMAVDQIVFYGSTSMGYPTNQLYTDADNDGYGVPNTGIPTCSVTAPMGFSFNDFDCNDGDEDINPAATEIPCNNIDENCNAAFLDDDTVLPPPVCQSDTICSGEVAVLIATAEPAYTILWYDTADKSGGIVGIGSPFSPSLPPNNTASPQEYTFYAEATNFVCTSIQLCEVIVYVRPHPEGLVGAEPEICPGESTDLAAISIVDIHFTNTTTSFHGESPASSENLLPSTLVSPGMTTPYIYQMTSEDACVFEDTVWVFLKPGPVINFSPADSFSLCKELPDTIIASASGGTGAYSYLWETGRMTNELPISGANIAGTIDNYHLTVTDSEGCYSADSVIVNTTNSIDSIRVFTTPATSCAGTDGGITIVPLNGMSPFAYNWEDENNNIGSGTNVQDTIFISGLPQNTYRVTITDTSPESCEVQLRNIRVQGPGFQIGETQIDDPNCAGGTDGEICLDVTGNGTITYDWSNGQNLSCASNLEAGTYSVTISNGSCTTVETYILEEPDSLLVISEIQIPECPFNADGEICLTIYGGTPNYSISWADGFFIPKRVNLAAGSYPVTVTDGQSCMVSEVITVLPPPPVEMVLDSIFHASCFSADDGRVFLHATGGTAPYQYEWLDGATGAFRMDLSPGEYSVFITDVYGCLSSNTITIEEPEELLATVFDMTNPLCLGDETGEVQLSVNGGTLPYTLFWSDGFVGNSTSRTAMGVGEYDLVIQDSQGCQTDTLHLSLIPLSNLSISAAIQDASCIGVADGAITVNVGGVVPIFYDWSNGSDTEVANNLSAGTYSLFVSDDEGCEADTVFHVNAPQLFDITSVVSQPSCAGVDDGIIDQSFGSQPDGPFGFLWSDNSQHVDRFELSEGEYSFVVTAINSGCKFYSDTFSLFDPLPLSVEITDHGGLACAGEETGFIETNAVGGTAPYDYAWFGTNITTSNIYDLPEGEQRLILTDARACILDTTFTLTAPLPLVVSAELVQPDICDPEVADTLAGYHSGGQAPFTYLWSTGQESLSIVDPPAGDYFISVTDGNDCTEVFGTVKIQDRIPPLMLDSFVVNQVSCFGGMDASMAAYTSGGSHRLQYHFTPTYIDTVDNNSITVSGLSHTFWYSVTVTDITTGCSVDSEIIEGIQPMPIVIVRDSFQQITCAGTESGALYVSASGGTAPLDFQWSNDESTLVGDEEDLVDVPENYYTLVVTDANLCTKQFIDSNVISLYEPILLDSSEIIPVSCFDGADGSIDIEIEGGTGVYEYLWSDASEGEDLQNLPADNYQLTVTDSEDCSAVFTGFIVEQPDSPILINSAVDSITCNGYDDASITLMVSGGLEPYEYRWRRGGFLWPSQTMPVVSNLFPTTYVGIITDSLGCVQQQIFEISEPTVLELEILNMPTGIDSLEAAYTGGTPPYQFLWSTEDTTSSITMLNSGNYQLTITDSEGCQETATFLLTDTDNLTAEHRLWNVFPNPAAEAFNISFDRTTSLGEMNVHVFDMLGKRIFSKFLDGSANTYEFDSSAWASGVYLLRFEGLDGRVLGGELLLIHSP